MTRTKYLTRPKPGLVYFRFNGEVTRLPADESSAEFAAAYDALRAQAEGSRKRRPGRPPDHLKGKPAPRLVTIENGTKRFAPPALGWFAEQWLASDFFAAVGKPKLREQPYSPGTQVNYRNAINILRTLQVGDMPPLVELPFHKLNPRAAGIYIAEVKRRHGGAAAGTVKSIISVLWKFALKKAEFNPGAAANPMRDGTIEPPYTVRQEHRNWPKQVIENFLKACDDNLHLAFYLLLCTGQRVGDICRLQWSQVTQEGGLSYLRLTQQKTKAELLLRLPKKLAAILERRDRIDDHILTHKWGRAYTRDSLTHRIKDVLRVVAPNGKKAASGLARSDYTTHGLRKNAGIMLALNGATVPVIMACLGHRTEKMAVYYVRLASQRKLAEQGADIMDAVFEAESTERVKRARAAIRRVK